MPLNNSQADTKKLRPLPAEGEMNPQAGISVLGDYRLLRRLGEGGMSTVYLGYRASTKESFAVKVLADHLTGNPAVVQRFLKEAKMSQTLSHPNLVCGFASGRDATSGRYYLVMEFIDGMTAHQRLERDGRLSVVEASQILLDIARALEYLHDRKFVHRDIKPDNILLAPDGSAKLADLGVIKHPVSAQGLTVYGEGIGTPFYMPWEQTISPDTVDARSDLFALGATYYHLLTGRVPFPGEEEHEINRRKTEERYIPATEHDPELPREVDAILARLLAWDPRKRFQSATQLIETVTASGLVERSIEGDSIPGREPKEIATAPTRADLKQAYVDTPIEADAEQIWILKYCRNPNQGWRKLLGKTQDVLQLLENGFLPDEVYAARQVGQKFRRIRAYPEFRNVVSKSQSVGPKSPPAPSKSAPVIRKPSSAIVSKKDWSGWLDSLRGLCLIGIVLLLVSFSVLTLLRILVQR